MYVMAINHDVNNYDQWKQAFDAFQPARGNARFHRVNRNVDHPNNITVVAGFNTLEDARQFRDNPDLKQAMHDAGITGTPRVEIFDEVESTQY